MLTTSVIIILLGGQYERFLCKENVRETLASQGISLTTFHNTFLYIRGAEILK